MLKILKIIFVILTAFILKANAQVSEQWVQSYNHSGNSTDIAYGIAVDNSGNSYVTGSILNGLQRTDYATMKYNSSGVREWIQIYNGTLNDLDYGRDIAVGTDGNIYVTGLVDFASSCATIKYSPAGDSLWVRTYLYGLGYNILTDAADNVYVAGRWGDASFSDFLVIKYNSSGSELWSKKYNGPGNGPDIANGMAVDNAGNVYLTGTVYISGHYAIATVKYNSAGTQQWDAVYDSPEFGSDEGRSVDVDNLGNVYIAGYSDSTITGRDFITIKYNSSGVRQWIAKYNDGNDEAISVRVFDANSIYVTGPSLNATRASDFILIKYDSSGNQQWLSRYDENNGEDRPNQMVLDRSGNIYITGFSRTAPWEDAATVKFNSSGVRQWRMIYTGPGIYPDTGLDMALDSSGNVYVAGRTYSALTAEDYLTIKYSQATGVNLISSGIASGYDLSQNYPNPFNPVTKVEFGISSLGYVTLKVYDILGNEVSTLVNGNIPAGRHTVVFDASNLSSGIYFYRLEADGNVIDTKRMMLLK